MLTTLGLNVAGHLEAFRMRVQGEIVSASIAVNKHNGYEPSIKKLRRKYPHFSTVESPRPYFQAAAGTAD
jgi:hypothetical protein